mmetsp:Transcript_97825/g.273886  ORF Transcript_97825/g.273886 Transcript_97825/m.273886 type:complete len:236 (+) Transcript_97825:493-1200(+)
MQNAANPSSKGGATSWVSNLASRDHNGFDGSRGGRRGSAFTLAPRSHASQPTTVSRYSPCVTASLSVSRSGYSKSILSGTRRGTPTTEASITTVSSAPAGNLAKYLCKTPSVMSRYGTKPQSKESQSTGHNASSTLSSSAATKVFSSNCAPWPEKVNKTASPSDTSWVSQSSPSKRLSWVGLTYAGSSSSTSSPLGYSSIIATTESLENPQCPTNISTQRRASWTAPRSSPSDPA